MLVTPEGLGAHVGPWLYMIAAMLAFGEAAVMIGLLLPGETALLVAGFAAHQGWIRLWPMVVLAVVAAILGDAVGYGLGRSAGPRLLESRLGVWVGAARWERGERFVRRHGGKAVQLARSTAVLRALTPGIAGMAGMPFWRTFLPWNVAGGVLWGTGCVLLLGFAADASVGTVGHDLSCGPLLVLATVAVVMAWHTVRRRAIPGDDASAD